MKISFPDNVLNRVAKSFKEAVFPTRCLACGSFYHVDGRENRSLKRLLESLERCDQRISIPEKCGRKNISESGNNEYCLRKEVRTFITLMSPYLCRSCASAFLPIESPMCSKCGMIFKSRSGEDHVCGECIDSPKNFGIARSAGIYDQALMAAVHCLKYKGKVRLSRPLGILLFKALHRYWAGKEIDWILPVPLHEKKLKIRGYNPSFLLVKEWESIAEALDGQFRGIPIAESFLVRKRWTEPQTGLGRKKRLENIKNAFGINDSSKIAGKNVLLVDDVYTTGATVNECAKILLKSGAGHVDVLTLARAM